MTASHHLGTIRASCTNFGISIEDMLVVKALKEIDRQIMVQHVFRNRCMVQDLVPFLRAIGTSRSLETLEFVFEERLGKIAPSWVLMTGSNPSIVTRI